MRKRNPIPLICVLMTLALALPGCQMYSPLTALQATSNNNITQAALERAQDAVDFALDQSCAEAGDYIIESQAQLAIAAQAAEDADRIVNEVNTAAAAWARGQELRDQLDAARQDYIDALAEYHAAEDRLDPYFITHNNMYQRLPKDTSRIENMMPRADQYVAALQRVADTRKAIANTVSEIGNSPELAAFVQMMQSSQTTYMNVFSNNAGSIMGLFDSGSTLADVQAEAEQLHANANAAATQAVELGNSLSGMYNYLPDDRGIMVSQLQVPLYGDTYDEFRTGMREWREDMRHMSGFPSAFDTSTSSAKAGALLTKVVGNREYGEKGASEAVVTHGTMMSRDLADVAMDAAVEAQRNAILAHKACNEGVPPEGTEEYDVDNPFDQYDNPYPGWNSTFWDFSS